MFSIARRRHRSHPKRSTGQDLPQIKHEQLRKAAYYHRPS